jgi:AcrR family transcriptional regulator
MSRPATLTSGAILDAADAVAGRDGFEKLTIRSVAAEVGSSPMALYRHFPSKEALIDSMLDRLLGSLELPRSGGPWRELVTEAARSHRDLLLQHPAAVPQLAENGGSGPGGQRFGEFITTTLIAAGCSERESVGGFMGLLAINYGWALFAISAPSVDDQRYADYAERYGDILSTFLDGVEAGLS